MKLTYHHPDLRFMRRNRVLHAITFLLLLSCSACKRDLPVSGNQSIVQPLNIIENGLNMYSRLSGDKSAYFNLFYRANQYEYQKNLIIQELPVTLNLYPLPDTGAAHKPMLAISFDIQMKSVYSLFIYGSKAAPKYKIMEDQFPDIPKKDSITMIRFANFSNGAAISVNLKDQPAGSFVQSLSYESRSAFKSLPATKSTGEHIFEIRDEASGDLLATYTTTELINSSSLNTWIFKPNTLVFTGVRGATGADQPKIVRMDHQRFL